MRRWRASPPSNSRYEVTVQRGGVSPLVLTTLVGADSKALAAGLAVAVAELERGGTFAAVRVRRTSRVCDVPVDAEAYG